MRYIVKEPIIHTIADEEISEDQAIRKLLRDIHSANHSIFIEFDDPHSPDFLRRIENARVINVSEEFIEIQAFYSNASMKFKNIPFVSIKKIQMLSSKSDLQKKYKISRWKMMDIAEIDGI